MQVPLIIRPPIGYGECRAINTNALAAVVDIAPTLLDVAGAKPLENIRGDSLLSVVAGKPGHGDSLFNEIQKQSQQLTAPTCCAVRDDRYRMTLETTTSAVCELFDLQDDPPELTNRVQDPAMTGIISQLNEQLDQHLV